MVRYEHFGITYGTEMQASRHYHRQNLVVKISA
ncbi:uncharacterized protein METZ01_LOCUS28170 [marine metagenome]|uniref:Uncharacterized protein n=1 Tax=marine metagenome TaxID=408172 RepID=A0A381Q7K8_9ZZZZ